MIKAIIGLGNPGPVHFLQRHNIGFRIVDALARLFNATWSTKPLMEVATITIHQCSIVVIKPQTYMNSSGAVIPFLAKQGIKAEQIVVVHDELEKPFGSLSFKTGGSHKGHNGLKSIIQQCGQDFVRFRFGIGRPAHKDDVPHYVLQHFDQKTECVEPYIDKAVQLMVELLEKENL